MSQNFLPGELTVEMVMLTNQEQESVDIRNLVSDITIFESIDSPFLSGRVSVVDGLGILEDYKITGQESLTIKYRVKTVVSDDGFTTEENSIYKTFRVFSVSDVDDVDLKLKTYVLNFVDPKLFTCRKVRVNRVLRGSMSEILLKVLNKDAQFEKLPRQYQIEWWEKTKGVQQIVPTNWSIMKTINYCVDNADPEIKGPYKNSCFLYSSLNGGFKFMSLGSMLNGQFEHEIPFTFYPRNADIDQEKYAPESPEGLSTQILSFYVQENGNTLRGLEDGAYSSKLITYDPVRKLDAEYYFDLKENFEKNKDAHLSGFAMVRTGDFEITHEGTDVSRDTAEAQEIFADYPLHQTYLSGGHIEYRVNPTNAYSDEAKLIDDTTNSAKTQPVGNEFRDNAILERNAMLNLLSQFAISVTIPMRTDIMAGQIVTLILPKHKVSGDKSILNDNRYLITKIVHNVTPSQHRGMMNLMVVPESYKNKIEDIKALDNYEGPINDD